MTCTRWPMEKAGSAWITAMRPAALEPHRPLDRLVAGDRLAGLQARRGARGGADAGGDAPGRCPADVLAERRAGDAAERSRRPPGALAALNGDARLEITVPNCTDCADCAWLRGRDVAALLRVQAASAAAPAARARRPDRSCQH